MKTYYYTFLAKLREMLVILCIDNMLRLLQILLNAEVFVLSGGSILENSILNGDGAVSYDSFFI